MTTTIHPQLPVHSVPRQASQRASKPTLRIEGLVTQPLELTPADLAQLARHSFSEDFYCEEQWVTPQQHWAGPRLSEVVQLANPLPTAAYVRVHAGNYVVPISLAEAALALLADTLNHQPLTIEHGAPWRLALTGAACFTSVKWVERLELTAEPGDNVGERVSAARRRIRSSRAAASATSEDE